MENCRIFYVSPMGNDSNVGSKDAPFLTIERAYKETFDTSSDIIINLLPGVYPITETLVFDTKNTSKDRSITFKGDNATIFGGEYVTGWEKHDDKIYKAKLDVEDVRSLYINTFPAKRARTKYTYFISDTIKEGDEITGVKVSEKNFPKGFNKFEDMELVNLWEWECHRYKLTEYKYLPESHEYAFIFDLTHDPGVKRLGKTSRSFYLENDFSFLDEEGEFYFDKDEKVIYYYPYADEDLSKVEATVGKKEMFVHILGDDDEHRAKNVNFEGIKFAGGVCNILSKTGYGCYQSDALNEKIIYRSADPIKAGYFTVNTSQFRLNNADNVTFRNCEFYNMGSAIIGMNDGVSNVLIEGNIFRDSSAVGVRIGSPINHYTKTEGVDICRHITVQNNVFTRLSGELLNNCTISVYYENDIKILHNYFKDLPYTAVTLGWGWENAVAYDCRDMEVAYNHIDHCMGVLHDGGGVYTLGEIKNGRIHNNFVNDVNCFALYNDAGSAQISTYNNVVFNSRLSMYVQLTMYRTNNINVYNNFADEPKTSIPSDNETVKWEKFIRVDKDNVTGEAASIIANAGVEKEYKALEKAVFFPEGHFMRTSYKWKNNFSSKSDILIKKLRGDIEAEDFMEGGEGVGYHKTFNPRKDNNPYRSDEVNLTYSDKTLSYVIHIDDKGEWLRYEVDIPETADYHIDLYATLDPGKNSLMKIFLDEELLTDETYISMSTPIHNIAPSGPFRITKGKHIFRLEFITPYYFDKFRVYKENADPIPEELYYTSDEDYKDGNF